MNIGVHQVDRSLWLAGRLPQNVYGRVRCGLKELDVDTDYTVVLGMEDSSTINITGSSYPTNADFLLEVIGTEGRIWLNPLDNKVYCARSGEDIKEEQVDGFMEAIEELAERFIGAIRGKKTLEVDGVWGENVGRVVELACRSSEEGKIMEFAVSKQDAAPRFQIAS
jgi:predicted dehydrogenase